VLFLPQDHRASPRELNDRKAPRVWQQQKFNALKRAAREILIMRHGGELRGNSYDRRRRKVWLLNAFGTGRSCTCHWCGKRLTFKTLTQDRLVPGANGGRYIKSNLVPACLKCNRERHTPKPRRSIRFWQRDYTTKEFLAITL
jgi:5-methylcytosine-specific restriction endonuclease McrA